MLRCILKADEGGRVRRAAVASDKHGLACDRLREAFKDREGGQPVLQTFFVDEKRVPLIEPHDLQQAAADNRVKRPDAQTDLKLYRLKDRGLRVQHISGVCSYHFLALSIPRSGLASARGAGAPLLLPELARSSGREGGKGTKRRGFARPRPKPKGRRKIRACGFVDPARTEREARGGRTGRPFFPL
ncbi:hypothetical protein ABIA16_004621 [Sinorhizobium fredii]